MRKLFLILGLASMIALVATVSSQPMLIEERLIRDGRIKSDDLFFVLGAPESALS